MRLFNSLFSCFKNQVKRSEETRPGDGADDGDDSWNLFFTLQTLEVATNFFSEANKLGHGGFGPVFKVQCFCFLFRFCPDCIYNVICFFSILFL